MTIRAASFTELRLDHLSRRFGSMTALHEFTLTIRKGEFVALLGPSGCGKSTCLNIVAGLLPASSGSIWLDDRRVDTLAPEERGFGMVFQNYALFPHMTVRRNVGFGLKMRGVPRHEIATRVDEALEMVRLTEQADKLPGQLSGGQQQRVAIARAIVIEPPLVLMDEPLSNLDAKLRLEMRAEIRHIHNSLGCTTIYVTHDQEEALSLADRIVVMRAGAVRQVGTPAELYDRPDTLDVAVFMGFRNRLAGRVVGRSGGSAMVDVDGAQILARARGNVAVGDDAVIAVRTEDLIAADVEAGNLRVEVTSSEFHGHSFVCGGRTKVGTELWFRAPRRLAPGEVVSLTAPEDRVLAFAGGAL